jgi:hypothetical protein
MQARRGAIGREGDDGEPRCLGKPGIDGVEVRETERKNFAIKNRYGQDPSITLRANDIELTETTG